MMLEREVVRAKKKVDRQLKDVHERSGRRSLRDGDWPGLRLILQVVMIEAAVASSDGRSPSV
jgi:hypothetical protein